MRIATFNLENLDLKTIDARLKPLQNALIRLNADVLLLQEVNSDTEGTKLSALDKLINSTIYQSYERVITTASDKTYFGQRNLVILSNKKIVSSQQFKHQYVRAPEYSPSTGELSSTDITWERPILYAQIELSSKERINILNLHLKSKIPTEIVGSKKDAFSYKTIPTWAEGFFVSSLRRVGQALEARTFIDSLFDQDNNSNIIVGGDFNSDFDEVAVETILGRIENTGNLDLAHRELIPCEFSIPEQSRFSLYHRGQKCMLDHILISQEMSKHYSHAEIHNENLKDESIAFATDDKYVGSDHAGVVAVFNI